MSRKKLITYFIGKVNPNSSMGENWRENVVEYLNQNQTRYEIVNVDPMATFYQQKLDEQDLAMKVGRNHFIMQNADLPILFASDDISFGGINEAVFSKLILNKPLITIAKPNGKFRSELKVIGGEEYKNYVHIYLNFYSDYILDDEKGLVRLLDEAEDISKLDNKHVQLNALRCRVIYIKDFLSDDDYIKQIFNL